MLLKNRIHFLCIPVYLYGLEFLVKKNLLRNKNTTQQTRELVTLKPEDLSDFYAWLVGFSDAEASFSINPVLGSDNLIKKITFMFTIVLHIDDLHVLEYIKTKLGVGRVRQDKDKCIFSITNAEGIYRLISVLDEYKLNSTKYLDYMNFKKAFLFYITRDKVLLSSNTSEAIILTNQILNVKNSMNTKRTNTTLPSDHSIVITKGWLLGYIEGDGSFFISRTGIQPTFSISATAEQRPLFEKIKTFLEQDLAFDKYSMFKLKKSSIIALNDVSARETGKASIILLIKNRKVVNNYLIPYFKDIQFITKKGLDFSYFSVISRAVYNGSHRSEEIRSLILKLSYNMNNFRLSTFKGEIDYILLEERNKIINAVANIEYMEDGRIKHLEDNSISILLSGCVYVVKKPNGDIILLETLNQVASTVSVGYRTLKARLDTQELTQHVEIKGYYIRRIAVFQ